MNGPKHLAELTEEQQETAALAALGVLPPREAMAAPRRAIGQMEEAAALLAESIEIVTPPAGLRDRLLGRIAAFEQLKPVADVRADENTWVRSGMPGVDIKTLFKEPGLGRTTYLVRMAPGARLPAHKHGDIEQCLMIEGDIWWGDIAYRKGDFMAMGKDSEHPEVYTVGGNVMLLIAGHNEFHAS
jgi:anti-sigma factor ChrR (cupin superfamily)